MSVTVDSLAGERWMAIAQVGVTTGSGDCIHVVAQADRKALFFLADVAGHDARAARFARDLDVMVSRVAGSMDPGALLTTLNAAIEPNWPPDLFVSAVCFSLDQRTGRGSIAVAGQLPPIVKGPSSTSIVAVQSGPPLGVVAGQTYEERPLELAAGEVLVATTDGVTDRLAAEDDLLGLSRLSRIVDDGPAAPRETCAALLQAARRVGLMDDATILAVAPASHVSMFER
jgi:serine phosphatase RsbU (regulator of sigma subunit)